jgi:hypothetical protein
MHTCSRPPPLQVIKQSDLLQISGFESCGPTEEEAQDRHRTAAMREAQGLRVATATAMQKLTEEYEKLRGDSEAPPPKRRRSGVDVIPPSPVHRCVHDFDAEKASSLRIEVGSM